VEIWRASVCPANYNVFDYAGRQWLVEAPYCPGSGKLFWPVCRGAPYHRGHQETGTGLPFAVDSWFSDNGQQPAMVDLHEWKLGWEPGENWHE